MNAKIIPYPSQGRVRLVPFDDDTEYLPPAVRQLLAIMTATEHKNGSISARQTNFATSISIHI